MNEVLPGTPASAPRQREADLLHVIRSDRLNPGMRAMTELLKDRLAKANTQLHSCSLAEFPSIQARAAIYAGMIAEINA